MKILQISTNINSGSTGRIGEEIGLSMPAADMPALRKLIGAICNVLTVK